MLRKTHNNTPPESLQPNMSVLFVLDQLGEDSHRRTEPVTNLSTMTVIMTCSGVQIERMRSAQQNKQTYIWTKAASSLIT